MLKIDQEWKKSVDGDIKNAKYEDNRGSIVHLFISKDKSGCITVFPYEVLTKESHLSLAAAVAEELYYHLKEFTLRLPRIQCKVKIDSYSQGKVEGIIMASVAEALRNGDISLF